MLAATVPQSNVRRRGHRASAAGPHGRAAQPGPRCPGQILLSAGTKGKRYALPHARILMHRGSAGIGGSAVDIEVQADDLRHTVDTVLGLISQDTGQPVERIFDDSLHDHWYTAEEARDYGFIDGIVESFAQVMPARKHRIGLKGEAA